jgi:hypothetical protein
MPPPVCWPAPLAKVFRSALRGASKDRPELAATAIPLEIRVPVLPGTVELVTRLFAPAGLGGCGHADSH